MKKLKLVLPVVALMSLSACGGNGGGEVKDGKLPSGGTEVKDEAKDVALAAAGLSTYQKVKNNDSFGVKITSEGNSVTAKGGNTEFSVNAGGFTLNVGVEKLYGNKEEFRAGLNFSGVNVNAEYKLPDKDKKQVNAEVGKYNVYLANDNVYIDASESNLVSNVITVLNEIDPYKDQVFGLLPENYSGLANMVYTVLKAAPETTIKGLLGPNLKAVYTELGINYPVVERPEVDLTEDDMKQAINSLTKDNRLAAVVPFAKVYTYADKSVGIQFSFTKEAIEEVAGVQPDDMGFTISAIDYEAALLTDSTGVFKSFELKGNAEIKVPVPEEYQEQFGNELVFTLNNSLKAEFNFAGSGVSFPSDYSGYSDIKENLSGFISGLFQR